MKCWLDDSRDPELLGHIDWVWVKTAQEAIELLQTGRVEEASLDYDLGKGMATGLDVLAWLEENPEVKPAKCNLHSADGIGRAAMREVLQRIYPSGK